MTDVDSGCVDSAYPGWRSMLFVPVHVDKFVEKAHTRGADAYILDMEDSVPLTEKALARSKVQNAARLVGKDGAGVLVRINLDPQMARQDLEAAVCPQVQVIVLPKVESGQQVIEIVEMIDQLEKQRDMQVGSTRLIAMIESVEALPVLDDIACSSDRVVALTLGSEDFSASAGMKPIRETLMLPNQMIAYACRRAGKVPLGFMGSIAAYSDLEAFRDTIRLSSDFGFVGAFCIHPRQAAILNEELTPAAAEVEQARKLIAAFDAGVKAGKGAIEFNGKMVDLPVVKAARQLIARAEAIHRHA